MIEETKQTITYEEPYHLKLIKYAKGYGWEIGIRGKDPQVILKEIEQIDGLMNKKYQPEVEAKND